MTRHQYTLWLATVAWVFSMVAVGLSVLVLGRADCFSYTDQFRREDIRWSITRGCEVYVEDYAWVPMTTVLFGD